MIPISHYNWFGEPPLKEKIKDILMMTWILFLCPLIMFTTLVIVFWGGTKLIDINRSQIPDKYYTSHLWNNETTKHSHPLQGEKD